MAQRKSLTKKDIPVADATPRVQCSRCGLAFTRHKGYFHPSNSPLFRGTGYMPLCIDCVDATFNRYLDDIGSKREAMHRICTKMDIYWSEEICDAVERSENVRSYPRGYISKSRLLKYSDKTYDDTISESGVVYSALEPVDVRTDPPEERQEVVDPKWIESWGKGYDYDFYVDLERRYQKYTGNRANIAPTEESLYRQVCLLETKIARAGASGEAIDKDITALGKVLGDLGVKPTQQKDDDDSSLDKIPFGVGIGWCEQHKPISDPSPEFKDVDGIVHYITAWFYGHLAKMVGKKNIKSQIYDDEMARWTVQRPRNGLEDDDEYLYATLDPGGGEE